MKAVVKVNLREESNRNYMQELADDAGLDLVIDENWGIGEFLYEVMRARGFRTKTEFENATGLGVRFLSLLIGRSVVPQVNVNGQGNDGRFTVIANTLALNPNLFMQWIENLRGVKKRAGSPGLIVETGRVKILAVMKRQGIDIRDPELQAEVAAVLREMAARLRGSARR